MFAKRFLQITVVLVVLAACLAVPRGASANAPCGSTYIVQPGDWLSKIANRCGVTLSNLYLANPGVQYQRYIYPGQVLNIPGVPAPVYPTPAPVNPQYPCPTPYCQPYLTNPPSAAPQYYWWPSMLVTPHVGNQFFSAAAQVGKSVTLQAKIQNNGNVPLQVTALLTPPSNLDVNQENYDCPDVLNVAGVCTYTWVVTPLSSGYIYFRIYGRGFYTDVSGASQRVTNSPAFFFNVSP